MARNQVEDVFQALLLREVVLADGVQGDLQRAALAGWLGEVLAQPATLALDHLVQLGTNEVVSLPREMTKAAIVQFFRDKGALYSIRAGRGVWSRLFRDREHTAHSYCRTALCYAVRGDYVEAEAWLLSAEERVGDLARPDYIRGLMCGAQGQLGDAANRLRNALQGRAKADTRGRVAEALGLVEPLQNSAER